MLASIFIIQKLILNVYVVFQCLIQKKNGEKHNSFVVNQKQRRFVELAIEYAGDYQRAYMDAYHIDNAETARVNCYKLLQNATIRQQVDSGLQELAKIRKQATIESIKEHAKAVVLSREQCLEITSKIAQGIARKINVGENGKPQNRTIVPSDTERLKAIEMLWKMQQFDGLDEDKTFGVIKPELPKTK